MFGAGKRRAAEAAEAAEAEFRRRRDRERQEVQDQWDQLKGAVAGRLARTKPVGTPIENAVEAHLRDDLGVNADEFRPECLRLAHKHIRPSEQILGVAAARDASDELFSVQATRGGARRLVVVAFSDGFGVRWGRSDFRSEAQIQMREDPFWSGATPGIPASVPDAEVRISDVLVLSTYWHSGWTNQISEVRTQLATMASGRPAAKRSTPRRASKSLPPRRLIRSARDAEIVAAEWMHAVGLRDAIATPVGSDGGVDVSSTEAAAQVKAETRPVGRPALQQHLGVCQALGKKAFFFSLSGYTQQALKWADPQPLYLFKFDLQGQVAPVNRLAWELWHAKVGP